MTRGFTEDAGIKILGELELQLKYRDVTASPSRFERGCINETANRRASNRLDAIPGAPRRFRLRHARELLQNSSASMYLIKL
jgi:hypothetical protein